MHELVYNTLERITENVVPNRTHELLHVNCRTAFTEIALELLERNIIKPTVSNVKFLTENWENVLYTKYSNLN